MNNIENPDNFKQFAKDAFNTFRPETREYLEKELGFFATGDDIIIDQPTTLPPEMISYQHVLLDRNSFPKGIKIIPGVLSNFNISARSCLSQVGIEVDFTTNDIPQEFIDKINAGEKVATKVAIRNNGPRPVYIDGGLFRLYWVDREKRIEGKELAKATRNLFPSHTKERDWLLVDLEGNETNVPSEAVAIKLLIKKKMYIPPSNDPLSIGSKKDIEGILKPLPKGTSQFFEIGETCKVNLDQNIIGEINVGVGELGDRHLQSPLIDPGFIGKIRTEKIGARANSIELFLYGGGKINEK